MRTLCVVLRLEPAEKKFDVTFSFTASRKNIDLALALQPAEKNIDVAL
jgi:hypothetical protein